MPSGAVSTNREGLWEGVWKATVESSECAQWSRSWSMYKSWILWPISDRFGPSQAGQVPLCIICPLATFAHTPESDST